METILKCSVCFEIFENPRVLPCQHTFCAHCLVGIARARGGVVVCPQCRESYPVPRPQGVGIFPANLFINNVIDFINDGSLLKKENNCSSCAGISVASCRCLFCGEFLCKDCGPNHDKQKESEEGSDGKGKHQIAELSVLTNASSVKPKGYPICPKHSDEILKYHCENCERAICRDCSVFGHRDHKVILMKDTLKELKGTVGVMLKEGRDKIPHIEESLKNTGSLCEKLKHQYENTCAAIKETKQQHLEELKKTLDSREQELLDELRECFESKNSELEERQRNLELTLGMVMSACDFAENKVKSLEQGEFISSKKEILDSLKGIEAGGSTEQEDPSAGILWEYSDNKLGPVLKMETQKAMGCLIINGSGFQSHAEAESSGLNESIGSSASYESTASSQLSEEGAASSPHNTSSRQAPHSTLLKSELQDLIVRINNFWDISPVEHFSSPSMHCNICGRDNHTEGDCHAKYDVNGLLIDLDDITCFHCGWDGHLPKYCQNQSTSSESTLSTVEDSSDDESRGCSRCGRTNHVLSECFARYTVEGVKLSESGNYEDRCTRCGRKNHQVSNCYARYSADGRRLRN